MELFYDIFKKMHKTIILITHDMDIVYKYATRVVVLNNGKISYDGDKERLFKGDIYKENSLLKPNILTLIDYLNEKLGYDLGYDIHDINTLFDKIKGGLHE